MCGNGKINFASDLYTDSSLRMNRFLLNERTRQGTTSNGFGGTKEGNS